MNEVLISNNATRMVFSRLFCGAVACIILTVLADFLFFDHLLGWTVGLFSLLLNSAIVIFNRDVLRSRLGKLIFMINMLVSFSFFETVGLLAVILNIVGLISLIVYASVPVKSIHEFFQHIILWAIGFYRPIIRDIQPFFSYIQVSSHRRRIIENWTLPLLLAVIFMGFFAFSNPIIDDWVSIGMNSLSEIHYVRILFWIVVITLCWAFILPKLTKKIAKPKTSLVVFAEKRQSKPAMVTRALVLFNLIFLVQTSLDISYLWLGVQLPDGLTYAEYAQKGAYPLIIVTLLAAIFVMYALKPGSQSEKSLLIRCLVYAWISQNILLTFASIWRTLLYVEAYSLTYLRVIALIWMGLVAAGLVWIIVRIILKKTSDWLVNVNGITLLGVLVLCCFVNFPGIIADYNVRHCFEATGKGLHLDRLYLESLGIEALPAYAWLEENAEPPLHGFTVIDVDYSFHALQQEMQNWRAWTYRKQRIYNSLRPLR